MSEYARKSMMFGKVMMIPVILNLFGPTNKTTDTSATTGNDLSTEMKTFYSNYLIDLAEPELVHDQFAQKRPIPANGGKTIEFRKYDSLPKALTPLSEGVTPTGNKLNTSAITATVSQYGDYIELSDVLLLTAIDNNLVHATELLASQAGRTLDTVTREVMNGGTNVLYAGGALSRAGLSGGGVSGNEYLTVKDIRKAVRALKKMNAPKYEGYYWGIIHPDVEYDIMDDEDWKKPHDYVNTENVYSNELGMIAGVRFVESTEAKIFHAADLGSDARNLKVNGAVSANATTAVLDGGTFAANALAGRKLLIDGRVYNVASNTASSGTATVTLKSGEKFSAIADDADVYPGEAGADGRDVYSTLIGGSNAYGTTEISGGGLEHIVKPLGSAGSADPLNQRATTGWKATKTAIRLVEQYMVRVEACSTFNDIGEN